MTKVKEWAIDEDLELLIVWPSQKSIGFYKSMGFSSDTSQGFGGYDNERRMV